MTALQKSEVSLARRLFDDLPVRVKVRGRSSSAPILRLPFSAPSDFTWNNPNRHRDMDVSNLLASQAAKM